MSSAARRPPQVKGSVGSKIAFVASNDTHVDMFAPVIADLADRGVDAVIGSLDSLYNQGVVGRAVERQLEVEPVVPHARVAGNFYRRPLPTVWKDVLASRAAARRWLRRSQASVVVLGNDRGLIEKLIIAYARREGMRIILVQDGALSAVRRRRPTARGRLADVLKYWASALLRQLGLGFLAASHYGQGDVDRICATGPHGAQVFGLLGADQRQVCITGQPRFDALSTSRSAAAAHPMMAVAFTTPFADTGLGIDLQQRQNQLMADLASELASRGVPFSVKPHPRDASFRDGVPLTAMPNILAGPVAEVLTNCGVAIVGISTVLDEAGIAGVPVVVPGQVLHAGQFDARLPPGDAYPWFETARAGADLIGRLLEDRQYRSDVLARQQASVSTRVYWNPDESAAKRVADVAVTLIT